MSTIFGWSETLSKRGKFSSTYDSVTHYIYRICVPASSTAHFQKFAFSKICLAGLNKLYILQKLHDCINKLNFYQPQKYFTQLVLGQNKSDTNKFLLTEKYNGVWVWAVSTMRKEMYININIHCVKKKDTDTVPVLVCYTPAHAHAHIHLAPYSRYTLVMMMRIIMKQCGRISVRTHKLARYNIPLEENEHRESNIITVLYIFRNVIRHHCWKHCNLFEKLPQDNTQIWTRL